MLCAGESWPRWLAALGTTTDLHDAGLPLASELSLQGVSKGY